MITPGAGRGEGEEDDMNPELSFIFSRRSVRRYQDREIPEEMLTDLLRAAMAAPSAVAKDPWHFIVIRKRETMEGIAALLPHGRMLRRAAAAIRTTTISTIAIPWNKAKAFSKRLALLRRRIPLTPIDMAIRYMRATAFRWENPIHTRRCER